MIRFGHYMIFPDSWAKDPPDGPDIVSCPECGEDRWWADESCPSCGDEWDGAES